MLTKKRIGTAAAIALALAAAFLIVILCCGQRYLTLRDQDGALYARYPMGEGGTFAVTFIHSVNLYPLTDYYEIHNKTIYVEATKYEAFGAGVQTELNPGEVLTYTDDGAMLITGIHQDRTGVGYIVGTVYDHILTVDGQEISLRDMCGRNAKVIFNYEFMLF